MLAFLMQGGEAVVQLVVLIVRPQIEAILPGLDDGIDIQGVHRIVRPAVSPPGDVGIDGRHVPRIFRKPGDAEVHQVFLDPQQGLGADGDVGDPLVQRQIIQLKISIPIGALDQCDAHIRLREP